MPQCSYEAVLQRVADALRQPVANLSPQWASLAAESTKDAAADLNTLIAGKGYADPEGADQYRAWHERLAFVTCMTRGAALSNYNLEALKGLDPRPLIEKAGLLFYGGRPTAPQPGESEVGGVAGGQVDAVGDIMRGGPSGWRW